MSNAPDILKTLIIYAVIVPLALFVGYLLTNPLDPSTFIEAGFVMLVLLFPLLLKWHQPLLILSWNLNASLFFLPGRPGLWLVLAGISLGITVLQRAMGGVKHLISVPPVTWSLVFLVAVVLFTAKMTGLGLRSYGSEVYGGRHYIFLLGGIMAYFALSMRRIPPEHATLYVAMFCLGGLTGFIIDLTPLLAGSGWQYIYLIFPYSSSFAGAAQDIDAAPLRFSGAWYVSFAIFTFMMAKYGVRGIFLSGKHWRWMVFAFAPAYLMLGGYRGFVLLIVFMFALQFYLEGLHRTKLLPIFAVLGLIMAVAVIPLASHLPGQYQRALAFLPLDIDPHIRQEAEGTLDWRFNLWKAVLPEVPKHLMLGKGYALSANDFQLMAGYDAAIRTANSTFAENDIYALAGTYHNGPLSVLLTFGIGGAIAFIWFVAAGIWVLFCNWRYGDPALQTVNLFLLVAFVARTVFFLVVYGALDDDMLNFAGFLGLGVGLNGGVCSPAPELAQAANKVQVFGRVRAHLQPTLRRPGV
ncbi:MAG: O-antigen ligase family protein [Verrucomicrobiia bacterium]